MQLFDNFEAVKFSEENMIFITHDKYLYYIYDPKWKRWTKYYNAGNDTITVENYAEITKEELMAATGGAFPKKEADFRKLCGLTEMYIDEILDLMKENYPEYISDRHIYYCIEKLLLEASIRHTTYWKILELLEEAVKTKDSNEKVLLKIKALCFAITGRDIFKQEIEIFDGHNSSSYFWIMPVKVIDYSDTGFWDNIAEYRYIEISIEEGDVFHYLKPFLDKYFNNELEANRKRVDNVWEDDDGIEHQSYVSGFEWYLTYNFYTHESIAAMLKDINDTIEVLTAEGENEYTSKNILQYTTADMLIDFYRRFIYRMEFMIKIGQERGYDLISFMGP